MTPTLLLICFILLVVVILTAVAHFSNRDNPKEKNMIVTQQSCGTCSGNDPKCEQECMMEAATKKIEYYEDEELDKYAGRTSDTYSDEEAEEFREIMYTMRKEEVKGWNRSLILRNVAMPDQIKDEAIMLMEE